MIIININDIHIQGIKPVARIDDFVSTQFIKLDEVVSIANDYNAPIICAGDVFSSPLIANSILTKFIRSISKLKKDFYFVFGNHDLIAHSMDLWERTSLGLIYLFYSKIKHISEFQDDYGIKWAWCDWGEQIDGDSNAKFLLIHQAIINAGFFGKNSWIKKDKQFSRSFPDKKLEQYDLILCGHWHRAYNFQYKNTRVINTGALTRRTTVETNHPSIRVINLDTLISKKIKLKKAQCLKKVITTKHLKSKESYTENIKQFISAIQKTHKNINFNAEFINNLSNNVSQIGDKTLRRLLIDIIKTVEEKRK